MASRKLKYWLFLFCIIFSNFLTICIKAKLNEEQCDIIREIRMFGHWLEQAYNKNIDFLIRKREGYIKAWNPHQIQYKPDRTKEIENVEKTIEKFSFYLKNKQLHKSIKKIVEGTEKYFVDLNNGHFKRATENVLRQRLAEISIQFNAFRMKKWEKNFWNWHRKKKDEQRDAFHFETEKLEENEFMNLNQQQQEEEIQPATFEASSSSQINVGNIGQNKSNKGKEIKYEDDKDSFVNNQPFQQIILQPVDDQKFEDLPMNILTRIFQLNKRIWLYNYRKFIGELLDENMEMNGKIQNKFDELWQKLGEEGIEEAINEVKNSIKLRKKFEKLKQNYMESNKKKKGPVFSAPRFLTLRYKAAVSKPAISEPAVSETAISEPVITTGVSAPAVSSPSVSEPAIEPGTSSAGKNTQTDLLKESLAYKLEEEIDAFFSGQEFIPIEKDKEKLYFEESDFKKLTKMTDERYNVIEKERIERLIQFEKELIKNVEENIESKLENGDLDEREYRLNCFVMALNIVNIKLAETFGVEFGWIKDKSIDQLKKHYTDYENLLQAKFKFLKIKILTDQIMRNYLGELEAIKIPKMVLVEKGIRILHAKSKKNVKRQEILVENGIVHQIKTFLNLSVQENGEFGGLFNLTKMGMNPARKREIKKEKKDKSDHDKKEEGKEDNSWKAEDFVDSRKERNQLSQTLENENADQQEISEHEIGAYVILDSLKLTVLSGRLDQLLDIFGINRQFEQLPTLMVNTKLNLDEEIERRVRKPKTIGAFFYQTFCQQSNKFEKIANMLRREDENIKYENFHELDEVEYQLREHQTVEKRSELEELRKQLISKLRRGGTPILTPINSRQNSPRFLNDPSIGDISFRTSFKNIHESEDFDSPSPNPNYQYASSSDNTHALNMRKPDKMKSEGSATSSNMFNFNQREQIPTEMKFSGPISSSSNSNSGGEWEKKHQQKNEKDSDIIQQIGPEGEETPDFKNLLQFIKNGKGNASPGVKLAP